MTISLPPDLIARLGSLCITDIHQVTPFGKVVTGTIRVELEPCEDGSSFQPRALVLLSHDDGPADAPSNDLLTAKELDDFYDACHSVLLEQEQGPERLSEWVILICERFAAKGVLQ